MGNGLPTEKLGKAYDVIAAWRGEPDAVMSCPVCGAEGLSIIDQSARPYTEWYALSCAACGLDAKLSLPLAGPAGGP